ncbi:hypothetical protein NDU88_012930, partial [Pleurodeles waltl]
IRTASGLVGGASSRPLEKNTRIGGHGVRLIVLCWPATDAAQKRFASDQKALIDEVF